MASLLSFPPSVARPQSASGNRRSDKSDAHRRRASTTGWWTPIFGWPADPDYVDSQEDSAAAGQPAEKERPRLKFALGCFTEEKARQLRLKNMETETFHDIMYHSAIASRLASDRPDRYGH